MKEGMMVFLLQGLRKLLENLLQNKKGNVTGNAGVNYDFQSGQPFFNMGTTIKINGGGKKRTKKKF